MKRRNFIAGIGALSTAGAAAIGSGAFSSAEAVRSASVEIADDADAYLALRSTSSFAEESGGVIEINFDDLEEPGGDGVGEQSFYEFGDVFDVVNQGTEDVELTPQTQSIGFDSSGNETTREGLTEALDHDDSELVIWVGNKYFMEPRELTPGDSQDYTFQVYALADPPEIVETHFEINANEV